jgi:hypothetical protein
VKLICARKLLINHSSKIGYLRFLQSRKAGTRRLR